MSYNDIQALHHTELPPGADGTKTAAQSVAMGVSAVVAIFSGLAAAVRPTGKVYVTFQPTGGNLTQFGVGTSAAVTAGVTNSGAWVDGTKIRLLLNPSVDTHMRITGSAGTLKWWVSSPEQAGTQGP